MNLYFSDNNLLIGDSEDGREEDEDNLIHDSLIKS